MQNVTGGDNYASSVGYTADGGLSTMTLGNAPNTVTQTYSWNDRFQPVGMTAGQVGMSPLLQLGLFPCPPINQINQTSCAPGNGTGNNGNLLAQTITMPLSQTQNLTLTQTYTYDHLNRLTNAQETGGGLNWTQSYGYDTIGNRWVTTNSNLPTLTNETPQSQSWYSTTVPNRIASWSYDNNGNVLQIANVVRSFTYDGENNQVTATVGSGTSTYVYDGLGQRVSKTVSGQTTTYVYDAFGNLAAEYGGQSTGCGTCYVTTDHLGSTRLLTNSAGTVFARYDYEPFGAEIGAGYDGRTAPQGYTSMLDTTNPKFTGQMRDQETTLDFFNVRYNSGAQGRFQSPDPGNAGADPSNPQSWNAYAYVGNNPLSYTDPSGMITCVSCVADESGNPVVIGIAAAIDIGELLGGLFEGLFGGGPPPSIPSSLATPSSPIMGPTFSVTGWGTADTVAPSWSAVDGMIPVVIPGLTFYAQGTGQAGRSGAPSQNSSPCTLTTPGGKYTLGPNAVAHFQPPMANALTNAFNNLNSEGITPQITSGFRSPADQMRMRNGASGPNPAAVVSWHEVGMAVDINGTASSYFSKIISAMKGQGLTWGGNFSHRDPPHFQLPRAGTRPPAAMVSACGGG